MFGNISLILVCLLSVYIICSFYLYTKEGDLNNSLKGLDILYQNNDKDEIIRKLFEHAVISNSKVRWPILMAISIVFAIIISHATNLVENNSQKFFIILPLLFLPLYITFNYLQAHGGNKRIIAASQLFALNKAQNGKDLISSLPPINKIKQKKYRKTKENTRSDNHDM